MIVTLSTHAHFTDCQRVLERLTPYVDNALATAERAEIDQHLSRCVRCRSAALREQCARAAMRQCASRLKPTVPAGLKSRCEALAREHAAPRARTPAWTSRLLPMSLMSVLILLAAAALFSLATHRSNTVLATQLTADHAKCFSLFAPSGSSEVDAGTVEQMLAERHGWDVHVPPSSPAQGVHLIGARRCLYADGRMPHVMYRVQGQDVSLYMLEGVNRTDADVVTLGHRSRIWSRGTTTYVVVSPKDGAEMADATRYLMQEAH